MAPTTRYTPRIEPQLPYFLASIRSVVKRHGGRNFQISKSAADRMGRFDNEAIKRLCNEATKLARDDGRPSFNIHYLRRAAKSLLGQNHGQKADEHAQLSVDRQFEYNNLRAPLLLARLARMTPLSSQK